MAEATEEPPMLATHAIHLLPSVNPIPTVFFKGKKEGMADESTKSLIRAYGTAKGQQFIILFDMGSFEDAISLQLARKCHATWFCILWQWTVLHQDSAREEGVTVATRSLPLHQR